VLCLFAAFLMSSQHSLPQVQVPQASLIHVDIAGLRNDGGQVFCALYSSADGFPKDSKKAIARVVLQSLMSMRSANSPESHPALMLCRYSTMKIPTASWTLTSWAFPVKG